MMPRILPLASVLPLALAAAACSSPPPTPAAVGASLTLTRVASGVMGSDRSCNAGTAGGFTYEIGSPNPGKTIEDGKGGVHVNCTVQANGSFNASAEGQDKNGGKHVSFTFNGYIHDRNMAASNPGGMTFFSPDTDQLVTLDNYPQCTFGPVGTLKKGALLTDVDCPVIGTSDSNTGGCSVHGTIAFEYCKTGEEQD
jgi:hypothetical protein